MGISEKKMQIVINNYFKQECDVNTSIRGAFEKGFRIGVKKALSAQPKIIRCKNCKHYIDHCCYDRNHIMVGLFVHEDDFCSWAAR